MRDLLGPEQHPEQHDGNAVAESLRGPRQMRDDGTSTLRVTGHVRARFLPAVRQLHAVTAVRALARGALSASRADRHDAGPPLRHQRLSAAVGPVPSGLRGDSEPEEPREGLQH